MTAKAYCFASAKGGSGKTILAATMGTMLANLGKRCLLIDSDATTNGMTLLFLENLVDARPALVENAELSGLFDESEADPLTFEISQNLSFLPASYVLHDTQMQSIEHFRTRLSATLSAAREDFDFILIDAQAGVDVFACEAMRQADQLVIVSEWDPISAKGVERLKKVIPSEVTIDNTWVLFNKVLPEFTNSLGDFLVVSQYLPPVSWSADVVRAYVKSQLALDMEKGNVFTLVSVRRLRDSDESVRWFTPLYWLNRL